MKRGANVDRGTYSEFRKAVEKARSEAEARTVAIVAKAMPDNWQAAAWWLERSFPDKWGRRPRETGTKVNVITSGPAEVKVESARAKLARRLADIADRRERTGALRR